MNVVREAVKHRDLLLILIQRNIKIRYKNSALGFFWTLLSPLLLIAIYWTFLKIMRFNIALPTLVIGIITWQYLSMCMGDALHAIVGNANLIKKSAFPRFVLPLSMTLANLVNLVLSLLVVFVYLLLDRAPIGPLAWLPLIILTQFALCTGCSLIVASLNVYFRDLEHILSIVLLAWFFLTPVIYPLVKVSENPRFGPLLQWFFFANPMTGILTAYRGAFLSEAWPATGMIALSFAVAWLMPLIGLVLFQKLQFRFADVL